MDMLETLRRTGGIEALARQLDLAHSESMEGVRALLPLVLGGFKRHSLRMGAATTGLAELVTQLNGLGGAHLAAEILSLDKPSPMPGEEVLKTIFGSPEASEAVAGAALADSEMDAAPLREMLPLLAMLVGGYFCARGEDGVHDHLAELLDLEGEGNPLDAVLPRAMG